MNPIQYTSKTYNQVLADINADNELAVKPSWFKRLIAGLRDVFSIELNAQANNSYLPTCFTRRAALYFARTLDYTVTERSAANGDLLFYLKTSTTFPVSFASGDLVALTSGSVFTSSKRFESRTGETVTQDTGNFTFSAGDNFTVSRVFTTGEKVTVESTVSLPGGLSAGVEYWIIKISDTVIQFAETLTKAYAGEQITITSAGSGTFTFYLWSFLERCYQQETRASKIIGKSNGASWQEFTLPDKNILVDTLTVTILAEDWTKVDSVLYSGPADKHYRAFALENGDVIILFGDDVTGAIPTANADIYVQYAVGGGLGSNISVINGISIYAGSRPEISGVSNPEEVTGGEDAESIEDIKNRAPIALRTRERFVTAEDGKLLAEGYAGIGRAECIPNVYGVLSAQVLVVASGGGTVDSLTKAALQTYLINRTVLGSIDVRVEDPTFITVDITQEFTLKDGYVWADVEDYFTLAARLFFYEAANELITQYNDSGVSVVTETINSKWTYTFDETDYTQISTLMAGLELVGYVDFGDTIQKNNYIAFIDAFVISCEFPADPSAPVFPVSLGTDEITTPGTMTFTEA